MEMGDSCARRIDPPGHWGRSCLRCRWGGSDRWIPWRFPSAQWAYRAWSTGPRQGPM